MLKQGDILLSRYRIVRPLARGGMGAVYEARDERLKRSIALKETLIKEEDLPRVFQHEVTLLANLSHPTLPKVFDHFTENDGQYMVMELISGDDLGKLLEKRGQPFPLADVCSWYAQLIDALEYLHTRTIVHRDLKPSNLKVKEGGGIVLLDFGLAKGDAGLMTVIGGRSVPGYTLTYAPLEQLRCEGTTPQSDLYSLGATMYHLLTNIVPTDASKRELDLLKKGSDPLRPLAEVRPDLPPQLEAMLTRALRLEAQDRPASAAAMRLVLPRPVVPFEPPEHVTDPNPQPGPQLTVPSVPTPDPLPLPRDPEAEDTQPMIPGPKGEVTVEIAPAPSTKLIEPAVSPADEPPAIPREIVPPPKNITPPPVRRPDIVIPQPPPEPPARRPVKLILAISVGLAALTIFILFAVTHMSTPNNTNGPTQVNNNTSTPGNQASPAPKATPTPKATPKTAPNPANPDPRKLENLNRIQQH
jgi:serine/threonine protein kinase